MFKLFHSIFNVTQAGAEPYPDKLVEKAIERAVDGLDARIRVIGGYQKRLRPSIIHAIDHVVKLVDDLAPPIDASRKQYGRDPYLSALFASANELQQFFSNDPGIHQYLDNLAGPQPEHIIGLLMMSRTEKQVFGMEIQHDMLRRDVPQVIVSFDAHRLLDPNDQEDESRRFLKRRAFDHLIALALHDVSTSRANRQELEKQCILQRRKLKTFEAAGWGFDATAANITNDYATTQRELDELEAQLKALPAKTELLYTSLDALVRVFSDAPQKLWSVPVSVILDKMNIKQDSASGNANELLINEFHSANGKILTGIMVSYPTDELLPREKFLSGVERYLINE